MGPAVRRSAGSAAIACSLVTVILGGTSLLSHQQPTFRSDSALVEVSALVLDGHEQPIGDLQQGDFELREDGKRVPIVVFRGVPSAAGASSATRASDSPPDGRFIVLLVDNLRLPPNLVERVRQIARMFASRMTGRDVLAIVPVSGGNGTTTSDRAEIEREIAALKLELPSTAIPGYVLIRHIHETFVKMCRRLGALPTKRRVLVYIGSDSTFVFAVGQKESGPPPGWESAVAAAQRANVSVYVVSPIGQNVQGTTDVLAASTTVAPGSLALTASAGDDAKVFASATGGRAFVETNQFESAVAQVWNEAGSQYLLGYVPPIVDGKFHRIQVRVTRKGAHVRARAGRY